jgi:hypothetical protein
VICGSSVGITSASLGNHGSMLASALQMLDDRSVESHPIKTFSLAEWFMPFTIPDSVCGGPEEAGGSPAVSLCGEAASVSRGHCLGVSPTA